MTQLLRHCGLFVLSLIVGLSGGDLAARIQKGKKPSSATSVSDLLSEESSSGAEREQGLLHRKRQRVCNTCSPKPQVNKSDKRAASAATIEDLQLPLPCEAIGTSEPTNLKREVAWGELVVSEGPISNESVHAVKVVETTEDGRGIVELEPITGYEDNGFSCPLPSNNPANNCPDIVPAGSQVKMRDQRFQQVIGAFHFDPQHDALLIRFNDTQLRSAGAHIKFGFLATAAANPGPVANLWNQYYPQVNNHVDTYMPDFSNPPSPIIPEWSPLPTYPVYTEADVDCNWYPIAFDASLFIHPHMRGDLSTAPFFGDPAPDTMNDDYFHLINIDETVVYSSTAAAFLSAWGLPQLVDPKNFVPFAAPLVGKTKQDAIRYKNAVVRSLIGGSMNAFGISDIFLAPPTELTVGFQKCGDNGVKLNIFPRWDSYVGTGGLDDNGKTFYTKPSQSVLKIDPGMLCYEVCSGNFGDCLPSLTGEFCGGFIKNPSLVTITKCDSSILDCLCSFNLDETVLTAIVQLIEDILNTQSSSAKGKQWLEKQQALHRAFSIIEDQDKREKVYRALVSTVKSRGLNLDVTEEEVE